MIRKDIFIQVSILVKLQNVKHMVILFIGFKKVV